MLVNSVLDVFGPQALDPALALRHTPSLRFALSSEGEFISMFLQAIDRARALTAHAFEGSTQLIVLCTVYDVAEDDIAVTRRALHRSLRRLGVLQLDWGDAVTMAGENDESARVVLPFVMNPASLTNLLWGVLAREIGVRPRLAPCRVHLCDPARGMLVYPYDDRGLDVIGTNTAVLARLADEFRDWRLTLHT